MQAADKTLKVFDQEEVASNISKSATARSRRTAGSTELSGDSRRGPPSASMLKSAMFACRVAYVGPRFLSRAIQPETIMVWAVCHAASLEIEAKMQLAIDNIYRCYNTYDARPDDTVDPACLAVDRGAFDLPGQGLHRLWRTKRE